jgi:hypothetical protein
MRAVAIKKGQLREKAPAGFKEMGSLRCDGCGEEFLILHDPMFAAAACPSQGFRPVPQT